MGNAVTHFEIGGGDISFYAEVLGWRPGDGDGTVDTRGGDGINGGIRPGPPSATLYVETADPESVLARANELGGTTVTPVTEDGRAVFADPDGLLIGLIREPGPDPSDGTGGAVTWFEILGADAARTQRFYADLFGWAVDGSAHPDYAVVDTAAGRGIWGGIGGGADQCWAIVYAAVPDVELALTTAEKLGGSRISAPGAEALKNATRAALYGSAEDISMGWVRDPAGNLVGLAHKAES